MGKKPNQLVPYDLTGGVRFAIALAFQRPIPGQNRRCCASLSRLPRQAANPGGTLWPSYTDKRVWTLWSIYWTGVQYNRHGGDRTFEIELLDPLLS